MFNALLIIELSPSYLSEHNGSHPVGILSSQWPYLAALFPIVWLLMRISLLPAVFQTTDQIIAWIACFVAYTTACILAGSIQRRLWTGYVILSVMVCWLSLNTEAALLVIVLSTPLGVGIRHVRRWMIDDDELPFWQEVMGRIAITSLGLMSTSLIFYLEGQQTPILSLSAVTILRPLVSIWIGILATQGVGWWVTRRLPNFLDDEGRHQITLDFALSLVMLVLPLVLYEVGAAAFIVILGLTIFQAIRHYQIHSVREDIVRRAREVSSLYTLGRFITNNLVLEDVLLTVYREATALVPATTFTIGLFDEDRSVIDFPLVMKEGQRVLHSPRKLDDYYNDHVILTGLPLRVSSNVPQPSLKPEDARIIAYIGIPLKVGTKIIGVMALGSTDDAEAFKEDDIAILQAIANQASLAIRNANLYHRTVSVARNLTLINQSLHDVMFSLTLQEALDAACQTALEVTGGQKAAIFTWNDIEHQWDRRYSLGFGADDQLELHYPQLAFSEGSVVVVDTQENTHPEIQRQAAVAHFQACLYVPLRSGISMAGAIGVYHAAPHHYEMPEINLIEMLANQLTAAIDNAELLQSLELYASEQSQLVHLSRISSSNLDLERIVTDVCTLLRQMLDVSHVEIGLYHADRSLFEVYLQADFPLRMRSYTLEDAAIPPDLLTLMNSSSLSLEIYRDDQDNTPAMKSLFERTQSRVLAFVPMLINRRATGFILLGEQDLERQFNPNESRLIEMATNQISGQIHNARIHTLTEEELIQRLKQLSMIEDIAGQISRSLEPMQVIDGVLDAALRATGADLAGLAMLEGPDDDYFHIITHEIKGGQIDKRIHDRFPLQGVIGDIARRGEMIMSGDNRQLEAYHQGGQQVMASTLAVPLSKGDAILGVLNVESKKPGFFTLEHVSFIKSLAGHAAISIDNARMMKERQWQITTLTYLRELSLKVATVVKHQDLMEAVLQSAMQILDGQAAVLYKYDTHTGELVQMCNEARETADAYPLIPVELVYDTVKMGKVIFIPHVGSSEYFAVEGTEQIDFGSLVSLPLYTRQGRISDVMCIVFSHERDFDLRDRTTVDLIATQVAGLLENAALNEAIRLSHDRMRAILDSTRDGIILLDRAMRLQEYNPAAELLLGLSLKPHLNRPFSRILNEHYTFEATGHETQPILQLEHTYRSTPSAREYPLYRVGQNAIFIQEIVLPVQDREQRITGNLMSLRDVTEEKHTMLHRQRIQDMVLHDLSKPLASIVTAMDVMRLLLSMESISETSSKELEQIIDISTNSSNSLLVLVASLRDIPRLDKGELPIERTPHSVKLLAEEARAMLASSLKDAEITLGIDVPTELDQLNIDPELIRRVFVNLMHNAFKFTPPTGQIALVVDRQSDQEGYVRVTINDTGPGIPADMHDAIFDEYVQLDTVKPHQGGKGTGVGLTFCKLAVEAHGGRIWVERDGLLSGASFAMLLPLIAPSDDTTEEEPQQQGKSKM